MTAFLTNVFKQAELARLRAAEDPALTQITYIFAHDEPLPQARIEAASMYETVIIDGASYHRDGPDKDRPHPWFTPDACPGFHLVDWMINNGLVSVENLVFEQPQSDGSYLEPIPECHPSYQQVQAWLSDGRADPDIAMCPGGSHNERAVDINKTQYLLAGPVYRRPGLRDRFFTPEDCALNDIAKWAIECHAASLYIG